jgi:hypothetical protein
MIYMSNLLIMKFTIINIKQGQLLTTTIIVVARLLFTVAIITI